MGAWLWSGRRGVIAGVAASALHGAAWVDAGVPIEMLWRNSHPPAGVITRNEAFAVDETTTVAGIPVTTPVRTLFDLGRHLPRNEAVTRIDALLWTGRVSVAEVQPLIARYPLAPGLSALRTALDLADAGAESPRETLLRLLLTDAGMRPESTQIKVYQGGKIVAKLDMGWDDLKIGIQYDGRHHQSDRGQYVRDQQINRTLEAKGWIIIRVIAEDTADDILARVAAALLSRGWRGGESWVRRLPA